MASTTNIKTVRTAVEAHELIDGMQLVRGGGLLTIVKVKRYRLPHESFLRIKVTTEDGQTFTYRERFRVFVQFDREV